MINLKYQPREIVQSIIHSCSYITDTFAEWQGQCRMHSSLEMDWVQYICRAEVCFYHRCSYYRCLKHKAASSLGLFGGSLSTITFEILGWSCAYSSIMTKSDWSLLFYSEPSLTSLTIRTRSCSVKFVLSHPIVTLNHPHCQCTDIYGLLLSSLCLCLKFIHCLLPLGLCNIFSALIPLVTFFLLDPSKVSVCHQRGSFHGNSKEQAKLTRHKMKTVSSSSPILKI